jgi:carboxynorspermidine decarboxylase
MGCLVQSSGSGFGEKELLEFLSLSDHMVFNSFSLWQRFGEITSKWKDRVSFGIRINPQHQEAKTPLYDPSAPFSRLGTPKDQFPREAFEKGFIEGIEGYHFHNLCEHNSDALLRTWNHV